MKKRRKNAEVSSHGNEVCLPGVVSGVTPMTPVRHPRVDLLAGANKTTPKINEFPLVYGLQVWNLLSSATAMEGFMRSLFDLADDYERRAAHDEKIATQIVISVNGCSVEVRQAQLLQASVLGEEARLLREQAAKLRAPNRR